MAGLLIPRARSTSISLLQTALFSPPKGCISSTKKSLIRASPITMAASSASQVSSSSTPQVIDSHLHVWASPEEAETYPYFPGQEPTLPGNVDFLLQCMGEAGVDGALIVQPINHKFDHSYVTSALRKYPSKFVGCCLADPAEDGNGVKKLKDLVLKDGYRAVRFNPYLWPAGQKMTNDIGKAMFSKAGDLGIPVGFMCTKGLGLHLSEIKQLCTEFPSTVVLLDHFGFCKPPLNKEEDEIFSELLKLSRLPQVYIKCSALFRVSRKPYPYMDLGNHVAQIVSDFGANRVIDFPYVVNECGYKEAKEAISTIANQAQLSPSELEMIMGGTVKQLFQGQWCS
ncbi:Amidohydrolase-related [Dillenia turbinata]|uniref:Amidohydrolase-related n=1 Tax=Dillenia turbinata TaxID=194707 RepID=A0AAN8ZDD2_9MAGN